MNAPTWLPIEYREFHDVPRMFVVSDGESRFLFDAPFREDLDEYSAEYAIYRLPPDVVVPERGSWTDLPARSMMIGRIAVDLVRFDPTRRGAVDRAALASIPDGA